MAVEGAVVPRLPGQGDADDPLEGLVRGEVQLTDPEDLPSAVRLSS